MAGNKPNWAFYLTVLPVWVWGALSILLIGGWDTEKMIPVNIFWHHLSYFLMLGVFLFWVVVLSVKSLRKTEKYATGNLLGMFILYIPFLYDYSYQGFIVSQKVAFWGAGVMILWIFILFDSKKRITRDV